MDYPTDSQSPETKDWFVCVGETQDGPFSRSEIHAMLSDGALGMDDFLWNDEMVHWTPAKEVPVFRYPRRHPPAYGAPPIQRPAPIRTAVSKKPAPLKIRPKRTVSRKALQGLAATAAIATVFWAIPLRWFTPSSSLEPSAGDVSLEDLHQLRSAASARGSSPSLAVALRITDVAKPSFFIASNLPHRTRIEIQVDGIPDTLVGRFRASGRTMVPLDRGYGKSPPFQVVPGEYRVCATWEKASSCKTYFLGSAKNSEYERNLKAYHLKVQEAAKAELMELNQFASALEDQLTETTRGFEDSRQKTNPSQWAEFHTRWSAMQEPLTETFAAWTPETSGRSAFYGDLYLAAREAGELVVQTHQEEASFFSGQIADRGELEIQIARTAALARSTLLSLRARIQLVEKLPPTSNGMPQREPR